MRIRTFAAVAALTLAAPTLCFAQGSTATGAVGGAAAGAVVGGPVGAVVGGVAGATVGSAVEPPREVRTYVRRERVPAVRVEHEVIVGEPLPPRVKLYAVPKHPRYRFAIVNDHRVIVEPRSRRVIEVIE
jgi:hypothetical protein